MKVKKIILLLLLCSSSLSYASLFGKDSQVIISDKAEVKNLENKIKEDKEKIKMAKKEISANKRYGIMADTEPEQYRLLKSQEELRKDTVLLKQKKEQLKMDKAVGK